MFEISEFWFYFWWREGFEIRAIGMSSKWGYLNGIDLGIGMMKVDASFFE